VPFLDLVTAGRRVTRFPLAEGRTVIGRHPGCEIVFDAAAVSRQHAAVTLGPDGAFLDDLKSRNGTLVNGLPLTARRRLEDGDEIAVCGQRLVFVEATRRRPRTGSRPAAADGTGHVILDGDSSGVIVSQVDLPQPGGEVTGQHAEAKLRAVIGLNRAIGASVAAEDVLPRLLDGLLDAFPQAERGFVLLVDPQSGRLAVRAQRLKRPAVTPLRVSLSLVTLVADTRRAVLSADAAADTRFRDNESILDCRIRSVMCVPVVRADGGLMGVVQVDSRDINPGFTQADLEVLAGVAGQAAQAIEQALAHDERVAREQLARDLELAHRVQQGLLPSRPPELPGYEVFDFYESARHVGGDFFGYVPLADERLAIVLADVSGKGVSAALLMAALSADVRYCLASEPDLGAAVARINESFLRGGWDDRFATLVVAVLDPRRHVATVCNAGHLPAFLRGPTGAVSTVADGLGGLPLGMAGPGASFQTCEVPLPPGATLALFTDGISEALDHAQECYGFERVEAALKESGPAAVDAGRRILADVARHTAGEPQSDDICLICLTRSPEPAGTAEPAQSPVSARRGGRVQPRG
jgi:serine phosphatase RsbU (regulator of sigma subunit)